MREPDPINRLIDRCQQTGGIPAGTILHKDSPGDALYGSFKRLVMEPINVIFTIRPGRIVTS